MQKNHVKKIKLEDLLYSSSDLKNQKLEIIHRIKWKRKKM